MSLNNNNDTNNIEVNTAGNQSSSSFVDQFFEFFLAPDSASVLSVLRVPTGLMIAYIHLVWMMQLSYFMGPHALVDNDLWQTLHSSNYKWTYLAHTNSMGLLFTHELLALIAGLSMGFGVLTRLSTPLAWFLTLMTVHRMTGLLFGLDQIVVMLAMYLMIGQSGAHLSVDRWVRLRYASSLQHNVVARWLGLVDDRECSWENRVATRLIQIHLCVIYLFGGLGKMRGETWWDGTAMWYSASSYEYQSMDLTWIGYFPVFASLLTHVTLFWECMYFAIVWPRWTRPITLAIAVMVHGGIALFMGMITFGLMMIVANAAFIPSATMLRIFQAFQRWTGREPSGIELQSDLTRP